MLRLLLSAVFLAGLFSLTSPSTPAQANDFTTTSNVNAGAQHRYSKHWRKRAKTRRYRKNRYRTHRPRRESRDYLVTFPHTRLNTGTNF